MANSEQTAETAPENNGGEIEVTGQDVNNLQANTVSIRYGRAGDIKAEHVLVSQAGAVTVEGDQIELRQAGAQSVTGQQVDIRQGAALQVQADNLSVTQGGLVFADTGQADLKFIDVSALNISFKIDDMIDNAGFT